MASPSLLELPALSRIQGAFSLKFFIGLVVGIVCATPAVLLYDFTYPSTRDLAIVLDIENDTELSVDSITIESANGHEYSCIPQNGECLLGVFTGDTSFTVSAYMESGSIRTIVVGYAYPGSTHTLKISSFGFEAA